MAREMRSPEEWIDETTISLDQMTQRDRKMRVALLQAAKQVLLIEIYNYKDITLWYFAMLLSPVKHFELPLYEICYTNKIANH